MDHDKSEYDVLIGKRLRFFREKAGLTQMMLASGVGSTSSGYISQVENGLITMDPDKLQKAARILRVDPAVLTTREDLSEDELVMLDNLFKTFRIGKKNPYYKSLQTLLKEAANSEE